MVEQTIHDLEMSLCDLEGQLEIAETFEEQEEIYASIRAYRARIEELLLLL